MHCINKNEKTAIDLGTKLVLFVRDLLAFELKIPNRDRNGIAVRHSQHCCCILATERYPFIEKPFQLLMSSHEIHTIENRVLQNRPFLL